MRGRFHLESFIQNTVYASWMLTRLIIPIEIVKMQRKQIKCQRVRSNVASRGCNSSVHPSIHPPIHPSAHPSVHRAPVLTGDRVFADRLTVRRSMLWIWARMTRRVSGRGSPLAPPQLFGGKRAGGRAGRDCRSEIEVVPLAVNL